MQSSGKPSVAHTYIETHETETGQTKAVEENFSEAAEQSWTSSSLVKRV